MKRLIGLVILFFALGVSAQDSTGIRLIEKSHFALDSMAYWNMDALGYQYVSSNGTIFKIDTAGRTRYRQSIKSYGKTSALVGSNTMKLVHFSAEQQTLCFLDNTLTVTENCLELTDYSIINATLVSASSQPDKIWVMDQLNSTLYQLPIVGNDPIREIANLSGLLNFNTVTQIKEAGNKLYILTPEGIFILDLYGSLIDVIRSENVTYFDANDSHLYMLSNGKLSIRHLLTRATVTVIIPIPDVTEVRIVNGALFARTPKNVHKFELQMLD